jgi:light-regulated signal transduction histidine kinase (bacteriophytochrome)
LAFARLTRAGLRPVELDLSAMATRVLEVLRAAQPDRNVTIHVAPGLVARGDEILIRTVLENLLGNAWKYSTKTLQPVIEFGALLPENQVVFFVRDNGAGFNMKYADKLFGAFQRLHRVDEFPGHGIGLATVQRIIHRHGGRIWAEAEEGQGATFYFTLG